jgi:hypothetical protein
MEGEKEMILPAGVTFRVKSCVERAKSSYSSYYNTTYYNTTPIYDLMLEEISPESLPDPLPNNAELCTNIL